MSDSKMDAMRLQMVNAQLRTSDINDQDLLAAFVAVPREDFVAPAQRSLAYADREIPAVSPPGRKLLTPRTLGLLLKAAKPLAGERALAVGSFYAAAVLAALGCETVALETAAGAATGVRGAVGPLNVPPAGEGPFDVIVLNGAFEVRPEALLGALKEGGRLAGLSLRGANKRVVLFERLGGALSERALYDAPGDVLPGFERPAAFAF